MIKSGSRETCTRASGNRFRHRPGTGNGLCNHQLSDYFIALAWPVLTGAVQQEGQHGVSEYPISFFTPWIGKDTANPLSELIFINPLCTVTRLTRFFLYPHLRFELPRPSCTAHRSSQRHASTSNVSKFALDDRSGSRDATMDSLIAFDA